MAEVLMPQKKQSNGLNRALTIGGAALGGIYGGGFSGAMAGAQAGQMAGGLIGSNQPQQQQGVPNSAMQRRLQMQQTDNLATLRDAEAATATLPEKLRQEYMPPIVQARMLEERRRGMV